MLVRFFSSPRLHGLLLAGWLAGWSLDAGAATRKTAKPAEEDSADAAEPAKKSSAAKSGTGSKTKPTADPDQGKAKPSPAKSSTTKSSNKPKSSSGETDSDDEKPKVRKPKEPVSKTSEPDSEQSEPAKSKTGGGTAPLDAEPVKKEHAPNGTLEPSDLVEFGAQPPRVQRLIEAALALTKLNLTYSYGSADPSKGGMDCSGTIYYVLHAQGLADVPRDSSGQYVWVRKAGGFEAVISTSADSFEFAALQPGDLLFWSGTYAVQREIPVTHVMLYLGREKKTKQRVMFGASDGRSYQGLQRWGVSVFDFKMPKAETLKTLRPDFLGYGPVPGLRREEVAVAAPAAKVEEAPVAEPETAPVKKSVEEPVAKKPVSTGVKKSTPSGSGTSVTKKKRKSS